MAVQFEVDPQQEAELDEEFGRGPLDEYGWEDLMDGKIKKKTIKDGGQTARPEMQQDVICSVWIYPADGPPEDTEVQEETLLQHWAKRRFRIGEAEAPPVLELCLRHMYEGDECETYAASNMAFGPRGLKKGNDAEKDVPANIDVRMRVVLHKLLPLLTGRDPTWKEKLEIAIWRKAAGNEYVKRQELDKAIRCYKYGLGMATAGRCTGCATMGCAGSCLDTNPELPEQGVEQLEQEAKQLAQLQLDCGSNLAMVCLERAEYADARDACLAVLEECPTHVKALWRLAKAYLMLRDFEECEAAIKKAAEVAPDDAAVKKLTHELRTQKQEYVKKSKDMAGKMAASLLKPEAKANHQCGQAAAAKNGTTAKAEEEEPEEDRELRRLLQPTPSSFGQKTPVWLMALLLPVILAVGVPLMLPTGQSR